MRRLTVAAGPMTVPLLVRRFLADYARNPANLLILVLVPAGFVAGAAGSLAEISRLLSGTPPMVLLVRRVSLPARPCPAGIPPG